MAKLERLWVVGSLPFAAIGAAGRGARAMAHPVVAVVLWPPALLMDRLVPLVVDEILRRVDLTEEIRLYLDLDRLVATVDLDAVIARLDLGGLAEQVIAAVDLPEIIRQSTGAVTSDTVRGVRMRSISGDDALGRAVNRLRLRHAAPLPAPDSP
jgi:hypothetical protein